MGLGIELSERSTEPKEEKESRKEEKDNRIILNGAKCENRPIRTKKRNQHY